MIEIHPKKKDSMEDSGFIIVQLFVVLSIIAGEDRMIKIVQKIIPGTLLQVYFLGCCVVFSAQPSMMLV